MALAQFCWYSESSSSYRVTCSRSSLRVIPRTRNDSSPGTAHGGAISPAWKLPSGWNTDRSCPTKRARSQSIRSGLGIYLLKIIRFGYERLKKELFLFSICVVLSFFFQRRHHCNCVVSDDHLRVFSWFIPICAEIYRGTTWHFMWSR